MLPRTVFLLLIGCCIGGHIQDTTVLRHAASSRCPLGFIRYKSSCYLFSHNTATYVDAQSFCRYFNSSLARINSRDEEYFIRRHLKRNGGGVHHFIAGTDLRVEGIWTWENPVRRISYLNWYPGQPSNLWGKEHCLDLQASYGYRMNDERCYIKIRYICEKKQICNR